MTAIFLYNQTTKRIVNKEIDYTALKLMLLNGASFVPNETDIATTLSAFEVSGNGWPAGGWVLTGVSMAVLTTNDARLGASSIFATASGGDIGPADAYVIYDSVSGYPLLYCDFEDFITAADGTQFRVVWNSSTLIQFNYDG